MQFEEDSSIDGELAVFLSKHGVDATKPTDDKEPDENATADDNINDMSDILSDQASEFHDAGDVLMPACVKLNKLLTNNGFRVNAIQGEHIDMESRAVSIFVVDSWADSVHLAVTEVLERQRQSRDVMLDTSAASQSQQLSAEVLMSRISDMQGKLYDAEKKVKVLENDNKTAEEQVLDIAKKYKTLQSDTKLQLKHLEQKNQEHERRGRQKETEMQKLREKLFNIANADRQSAASKQHKTSLSALRQGEIINQIGTKQMKKVSSTSPNASFSSSSTVSASSSKKAASATLQSHTSGPVYMTQVIEAMEAKNNSLEKENSDLHSQVLSLSEEVKSFMNKSSKIGASNRAGASAGKSSSGSRQGGYNAKKTFTDSIGREADDDEDEDCEAPGGEDIGEDSWYPPSTDASMQSEASDSNHMRGGTGGGVSGPSGPKALLWEALQEQKQRVKQLEHRLQMSSTAATEAEETIQLMRSRAQELREELENVRLELDSRPQVKQFNELQRSHRELEEKLHDVIMMRKEAQELNAWRKHLSTAERIKIDKRNHELGLWLIDSLPKAVIKDVLQAACRELNINDISELQPTLVKLKTVIKAVPRMERFITGVCGYVFERQLPILPPSRAAATTKGQGKSKGPTSGGASVSMAQPASEAGQMMMEDVLPVLKSWWHSVSYLDELKTFEDVLLRELHRREHVLGQAQGDIEPGSKASGMARMDTEQQTYLGLGMGRNGAQNMPAGSTPEETWEIYGKVQWSRRDRSKVVEIIRELIDFQLEVFNYKKSLLAAEEYVQGNPESLICRLISHLKYLFGITSLEGMIPKMNQIYLFCEEMNNFMNAMRDVLNMPATAGSGKDSRGVSDVALMAEIQRIVIASVSDNE